MTTLRSASRQTRRTRTARTATLATTFATVLSALALTSPALAETKLRIGLQQEPTVLDPTSDATASIDSMLTHNVFESLTTVDESGAVLPNLASDWTISEDGLTYTFTLVEGATFHDGTAFDAEDVKFTFERAMAEGSTNPSKSIFEPIESVTVIDPKTIEFKLNRKDAFFLFNVAQGDASIIAPESVEANATKPVGTGPFMFDSWTRGDRLTLAKYADYRDAADVKIDKVEFRFISDPAAATAALMSEELDAFPGFPAPELMTQFEADPRFKTVVGSTNGEVILALNNSKPPFNDLKARQALSHAIDRAEIIDGAMYGMAVPIGSFYPPHAPDYIDLTGLYPHDSAKAKQMFEEAGVTEELTLRVPPFPYATRSGEIVQAELAKAGIKVKLENVEWGFWIDEVYKKKNYDMTIIAHTAPNDLSNFARGPKYFYGYQSDDFDALWNKIKTESDTAARAELTKQAQTYLAENAVHGFLFQLPQLSVYRNGVDGFWAASPVLFQPLAGVTIQ
ncbi:ABC transporter substrate-binding protein [Rhodalgimonas zhirmunskyi]|uniref:ABC transporter substrate-binding protein n=1 Tax=Rhodalgimonas zhirmunskyi TaxID=2964767 RepID=A0AAJ1U499_9RHOB|nr:ABC transporter substrate-binding protein [Rhodoalgimonas zhirmunskyi]MDQ2093400.1 ABC transporter substrate-binding protein [Rhodoalgimonas zhirmunskyi]